MIYTTQDKLVMNSRQTCYENTIGIHCAHRLSHLQHPQLNKKTKIKINKQTRSIALCNSFERLRTKIAF